MLTLVFLDVFNAQLGAKSAMEACSLSAPNVKSQPQFLTSKGEI